MFLQIFNNGIRKGHSGRKRGSTKDYVRIYKRKMQNKPNFRKSQMNSNLYNTRDYENKWQRTLGENKPNSNPIKANFRKGEMNLNVYFKRDYENDTSRRLRKNKPKQTQPVESLSNLFQKPISEPEDRQKNKVALDTNRPHEDQLQILRTGFIRCFFDLAIRFLIHLRVEFGFDYLFRPGCFYQLLRPYFHRAAHKFRNIIDYDT